MPVTRRTRRAMTDWTAELVSHAREHFEPNLPLSGRMSRESSYAHLVGESDENRFRRRPRRTGSAARTQSGRHRLLMVAEGSGKLPRVGPPGRSRALVETRAGGAGVRDGFDNSATIMLAVALAVIITVRPRELNFLRLLPFLLPLLAICLHLASRTAGGLKSIHVASPIVLLAAYAATTMVWSELIVLSVAESISIFTISAIASLVGSFGSLRELVGGVLAGCLAVFASSVVVAVVLPGYGLVSDTYEAGSLRGVMLDRNSLAFVLLIGLIAALSYEFHGPSTRSKRLTLCSLFVGGVLWTASSTCLILAAVSIAFAVELALIRRVPVSRRRWAAAAGALATAVSASYITSNFNEVLTLVDRDPSLSGRTRIWPAVDRLIAQDPWFGHGWGAVWSNQSLRQELARSIGFDVSHSHNGYLDIQLQIGVIGLVLTLFVLLLVGVRGMAHYLISDSPLSSWALLLALVLSLYNRVETSFSAPSTMFLMFATLVALAKVPKLGVAEARTTVGQPV